MLDRAARTLTLANGEQFPLRPSGAGDRLCALRAPHPRPSAGGLLRLPHPGGCAAIRDACAQARSGVVIGGGLLGLEAANALRLLGLKTQVVEFPPG